MEDPRNFSKGPEIITLIRNSDSKLKVWVFLLPLFATSMLVCCLATLLSIQAKDVSLLGAW